MILTRANTFTHNRLGNKEPLIQLTTLNGNAGNAINLAFSPDGWRLAAAYSNGSVGIWDATPRDKSPRAP